MLYCHPYIVLFKQSSAKEFKGTISVRSHTLQTFVSSVFAVRLGFFLKFCCALTLLKASKCPKAQCFTEQNGNVTYSGADALCQKEHEMDARLLDKDFSSAFTLWRTKLARSLRVYRDKLIPSLRLFDHLFYPLRSFYHRKHHEQSLLYDFNTMAILAKRFCVVLFYF